MALRRIKTLRSHQAHYRFLGECGGAERWIASCQIPEIRFPYSYSQSRVTFDWNGKRVLVAETAHRRYEVFEVPPEFLTFGTSEEAEEWHRRYGTKPAPSPVQFALEAASRTIDAPHGGAWAAAGGTSDDD